MGAKSKVTKKKGPKGKRARAKAKLEQVWGETVDEDARKASKLRVGKSRLTPATGKEDNVIDDVDNLQQKKEGNDDKSKASDRENDRDSDSSESEDGNDTNGLSSFTNFLKRIKRTDDTHMGVDSDDDRSSDGSMNDQGNEPESEDESMNDHDEPIVIPVAKVLTRDPFEEHFSKPPLPQLNGHATKQKKNQSLIVPLTQNIQKVDTPMLHSAIDVHLSGPLLDQWNDLTKCIMDQKSQPLKKQTKRAIRKIWEEFARGPYEHAREILTRNWRSSVNQIKLKATDDREVFSSLQLALYPAISRYADVMVTCETRQVSSSTCLF